MSNPTESNPSLGPLLPLYNTSTGQTNIAWDADPSTVATDAEGVTHGKAFISGTFSSTPPAGAVSTNNSSSTPLAANAVFTGTSESILAYGSISVQAYSDVASAAGGLIIEQSQDGTNWDTKASYSVAAATPFQATVNATGQYLRTVYTNGASIQTVFRLQTIKEVNASPSAGVANQRVNAQSGDFATGSIVDLTTLITNTADLLADGDHLAIIDTSTAAAKTDLDTIVTNTTGAATAANQATGNTSLASIVTNTNKIPASPAQEGGNLSSILTQVTNHTASQGAGAAMGTSWRTMGDYAEQASLSAGSLNADLVASVDVSAYKSFSIQTTGTWSGTLTVQGSNDNVNFLNAIIRTSGAGNTEAGSIVSNVVCIGDIGYRYLRIRMTAYTSGTVNGTLELYTQAVRYGTQISGSIALIPTTTGGTSDYHVVSAATNNAANIKASAGQVYGWDIFNNAASVRYVKLFNKATAPTPGTDTPVRTIAIPAGQKAFNTVENGMAFALGIGIAITAGIADLDNTAISASDVVLDLDYK